jgi:hypothetical protein
MAKQKDKKEGRGDAERRLRKAQLKYEIALEKQAQARERGKQEIDRARLAAAEWQSKASERVENRAAKLRRAEQEALAAGIDFGPTTPESVAEVIEQREAAIEAEQNGSGVVLPVGVTASAVDGSYDSSSSE